MIKLYGIKNCDSVKKARAWLEQHQLAYTFHDFRTDGLAAATLRQWALAIGWEALLNRRSKSWKELPVGEREAVDETSALRLMLANPTLIKRPVVVYGTRIQAGFGEEEFNVLFGHLTSSSMQGK